MLVIPEHVNPYTVIHYIEDYRGYIVWRLGSGGNIELLHIAASYPRVGYGTSLVRSMVDKLLELPEKPKAVFGFTRAQLEPANKFYQALGFSLHRLSDFYKQIPEFDIADAVIFHQPLARLLYNLQR